MKNVCVICDRESDYARSFTEYQNKKKSGLMKFVACSSVESLVDYAKSNRIDVLMVSEDTMCDEAAELSAGRLVVLNEGRECRYDDYQNVYKYQSCDSLLREVMSGYDAEQAAAFSGKKIWKKNKNVIAVYSPVGGCRKTTFSIALGQVLAKERPTLYVNLESCSGVDELLELSTERSLSDLLYYAKQGSGKMITGLSSMVQTRQSLDCIPGVASPDDIIATSSSEWLDLFDEIMEKSAYENLLIDIGEGVPELLGILDYCDEIYMPTRSDALSAAKLKHFMRTASDRGYEDLVKRLKLVNVPFHTITESGRSFYDGLIWGELGDWVKRLLRDRSDIFKAGPFSA